MAHKPLAFPEVGYECLPNTAGATKHQFRFCNWATSFALLVQKTGTY